jgi:predicted RNase H-like HicB family nuclease
MKYHFKIHKEIGEIWAECIELPGCVTEGENDMDILNKMQEVLNLFLSEPSDSNIIFPLPQQSIEGKNIVEVSVDPHVAIAVLVRQARLKRGLSQRKAAKLVGFTHLSGYQRMESAGANLTFNKIIKLKEAFPEINIDKAFV